MKTILKVLFLVLLFTLPVIPESLADEINPCDGVATIGDSGVDQSFILYRPTRTQGNVYCLVYNQSRPSNLDDGGFVLDVASLLGSHTQNVYISNLKLNMTGTFDTPLLTIINRTEGNTEDRVVIINNLQLSNVRNGLKLEGSGPIEIRSSGPTETHTMITGAGTGTGACIEVLADNTRVLSSAISNCGEGIRVTNNGVEVNDSEISGNATEGVHITGINSRITNTRIHNSPVCVSILGDGANVRSSTISNCGEGIRIAANNVFLGAADADHLTDMNNIHDNGVGIHVVSGMGNMWPYNIVRQNGAVGVADPAASGIFIGESANNDIARPLVIVQPSITSNTEAGAILICRTNLNGVILKRELTFNVPGPGKMTVFLSDRERYKQATEYVATCLVDETGVCVLENTLLQFSPNTCMLSDKFVTALFTSDNSSMFLADPIDLGLARSSIIMPTSEGPLAGPTGMGGGTGGGDGSGPPEGEGLYIEGGNTGTTLGTEQPGQGTGTAVQQVGLMPFAAKACRFASADNERAKGIFEMWWWLIFTLPLPYIVRRARKN